MIFLGHSLHDRHWPVGVKDDRMLMTLAGNGGGKGESAIINNLLTYPGRFSLMTRNSRTLR